MRNRIAHGHFEIDLATVWDTLRTALPDWQMHLRDHRQIVIARSFTDATQMLVLVSRLLTKHRGIGGDDESPVILSVVLGSG